jgi:glycosyltransferase involved in cell wall biosynthesis
MVDHSARAVLRPRVLHLSADFPDPINPAKTPVIARLLDLVANHYDHQVISLNRRQPGPREFARLAAGTLSPPIEASLQSFPYGTCLEYLAPSKGLLHATMLERLAVWIADQVARQPERPDLVIGHKLTVEGIVARDVARLLGIPFAITIQGNTDQKILDARRDLRGLFGRIYHEAACVFSFAPWAREAVEERLGRRAGLTLDLPCPTTLDQIRAPVPGGDSLISVFHLRNHMIKNLAGLARAIQMLEASGQPAALRVIGGGSEAETAACRSLVAKAPGMTLGGPQTPDTLGPIMNTAIALVMPSMRETFGLVFVEALFAGLPIIYPKGASVDGYFDGLPFAIAVNARKPREIAAAMQYVIENEAGLKHALAQWQEGGGLAQFSRTAIAAQFDQGLRAAIGRGAAGSGSDNQQR